jgi:lipoyl(octanoyl) transferase
MINWQKILEHVHYESFLELMEKNVLEISKDLKQDVVYLLEHEDVYTAGTGFNSNELLIKDTEIPVIYTGRGGKFTYHGPGQRVIYPLINLGSTPKHHVCRNRKKDIRLYIKNLEEITKNTLSIFGVKAYQIDGLVGIWVDSKIFNKPAKIAAIGVRIRKWVTYHGIAVNINPDLSKYNSIIPCGISDFAVTSLWNEGIKITNSEFDEIFKIEFEKRF